MNQADIIIWFESPASIVERHSIPPGLKVQLVWAFDYDESEYILPVPCRSCGDPATLITVNEVWTSEGLLESEAQHECDCGTITITKQHEPKTEARAIWA